MQRGDEVTRARIGYNVDIWVIILSFFSMIDATRTLRGVCQSMKYSIERLTWLDNMNWSRMLLWNRPARLLNWAICFPQALSFRMHFPVFPLNHTHLPILNHIKYLYLSETVFSTQMQNGVNWDSFETNLQTLFIVKCQAFSNFCLQPLKGIQTLLSKFAHTLFVYL